MYSCSPSNPVFTNSLSVTYFMVGLFCESLSIIDATRSFNLMAFMGFSSFISLRGLRSKRPADMLITTSNKYRFSVILSKECFFSTEQTKYNAAKGPDVNFVA